jgi:hypothetical protein
MTRPDGTLATLPRIALAVLVVVGLVGATGDAFTALFYAAYVAVGLILAIRVPKNPVSWLLIGIAFGFLGTTTPPNLDIGALVAGRASLGVSVAAWIAGWIAPATFMGFAALALVFPGGGLPVGRWRRPSVVMLVLGFTAIGLSMIQPIISLTPNGGAEVHVPNPIGVLPDLPIWPVVLPASYIIVLAALALAIASMLARYRGADDQLRLQLRWLLAAMAFVLLGLLVGLLTFAIRGDDAGGLAWLLVIFAYPCVPLAIGVAVLRYRLYEIDRIVNRALVYGVLTATLAGVFAAMTALSQRLFIQVAGQSSDASVVLTTLVVVALYAPMRKRVEALVDRYFKYDQQAYGQYLDELHRLLDLTEPRHAAARLAREALVHTGARGVAVVGRDGEVLASAGTWPLEPVETVPVGVPGSVLGAILVGPRAGGRPLPPARLRALADAAVVAAEALGSPSSIGGASAPVGIEPAA